MHAVQYVRVDVVGRGQAADGHLPGHRLLWLWFVLPPSENGKKKLQHRFCLGFFCFVYLLLFFFCTAPQMFVLEMEYLTLLNFYYFQAIITVHFSIWFEIAIYNV